MHQTIAITDPGDFRLRPYRDLKGAALRRLAGPPGGLFIIEGELALCAALASPYPLVSVLVLDERLAVLAGLELPEEVPVYMASRQVMSTVAGFDVHRGLLAAARREHDGDARSLADSVASPVVIVEGVNDQENLGAIFRNAAAFGAGAVLLDPLSADPLYRRTVRVSLGWSLCVPFARLAPWPDALSLPASRGFTLLALTPRPSAPGISEVAAELGPRARVALVVGAERHGLTEAALDLCRSVRIPMAPGVDSLNVAAATAIALYHFRQVSTSSGTQ